MYVYLYFNFFVFSFLQHFQIIQIYLHSLHRLRPLSSINILEHKTFLPFILFVCLFVGLFCFWFYVANNKYLCCTCINKALFFFICLPRHSVLFFLFLLYLLNIFLFFQYARFNFYAFYVKIWINFINVRKNENHKKQFQ